MVTSRPPVGRGPSASRRSGGRRCKGSSEIGMPTHGSGDGRRPKAPNDASPGRIRSPGRPPGGRSVADALRGDGDDPSDVSGPPGGPAGDRGSDIGPSPSAVPRGRSAPSARSRGSARSGPANGFVDGSVGAASIPDGTEIVSGPTPPRPEPRRSTSGRAHGTSPPRRSSARAAPGTSSIMGGPRSMRRAAGARGRSCPGTPWGSRSGPEAQAAAGEGDRGDGGGLRLEGDRRCPGFALGRAGDRRSPRGAASA